MIQECRVRAGDEFRTRLPNIETKYEGQRTDGTHAVNGTARFDGRTRTFQCSFNRSGRRIVEFVVNERGGRSSARDRDSNAAVAIVGGIIGAIALAASSHNHRHEYHRPHGQASQLPSRRSRPYSPAPRVTCYPAQRVCYRANGRVATHWTRKEF
jgi:hypothetical protein